MNQLAYLLTQLAGRWGSGLAGWAIVSGIIWYLFPIVPALEPPAVRLAAVAGLLAVYFALNGAISWRNRRRRGALAAGMADDPAARAAAEAEAEAAEEVVQLRARMKEALAQLKRKGWRGRQIYDQPWFVLIGPPGSGKTTALMNSGLHLPLGGDDRPSVPGVGGTRSCDWWFTDEAVLIDTAGRYTTQDSAASVDAAGWAGFLDLLRRTRPRQPINGLIVVLSLPELAVAAPAERADHAKAVRRRIDEITERLRLRVPVYLMLSKADQLRGFDAYFDDLDPAGRAQVWGMTFPLDRGIGSFVPEFRLLLKRLDDRQVERLQAERAGERRAMIGQFPLQVASLEQPLAEFLKLAFGGSRLDPAPSLRGVYITSATQQGTPIDRLTGMLARSFGVDQTRVPALRPVSGRGYFIARLVREVILGEALLITRGGGRWPRRLVLRAAAFAAVAAVFLGGGALVYRADADNRRAVADAQDALAAYRQRLSGLTLDPIARDDLAQAAPVLDAASSLPQDAAGDPLALGLSQRPKLAEADRQIERRALRHILLPRLVWRLEQRMRAEYGDPARLYDTTRVYLMLGGQGPLDADGVRAWMRAEWDARYPAALNAPLRESLARHLDRLLAEPLPEIQLDGVLVESARAAFSRISLAERIYSRVRTSPAAQALPEWTPAAVLGADGRRLFVRRSGRPLTDGVPGLFTGRGYREALQRELPTLARAAAGESWVLGHSEQVPAEGPQLAALEEGVLALYAADFEARWDKLIGDLALARLGGQEQTVRDLYVLSSPQSPLRDLLTAIAREVRMEEQAAPQPERSGDRAAGKGDGRTDPPAQAPASPALRGIAAHFKPLIDLVGKDESSLANILHLINDLQRVLAASTPGGAPPPENLQRGVDPAQLLLAEAERQPAPLAGWLRDIATSGGQILGNSTRAAAASAYAAADGPLPLCRGVVEGRYPFEAAARTDAPIDDFARLFGPGGQFDTYFQRQVRGFIDTRGAAWQPQALGGVAPPLDGAAAAAFQQIAAIRAAFFPAGNTPQLSFSLAPAAGNDQAATLTIGGTAVGKDPNQAATFTWPNGGSLSAASLTFDDPVAQTGLGSISFATGDPPKPAPAGFQASGPWALFRLLDRGRLAPSRDPATFELGFSVGGRRAAYVLQAGSVRNPFSRNLLRGFRCPVIR